MMHKANEKDWKLFRDRLPKWQEAYMETLIGEYQKILTSEAAASDRFWEMERRLQQDKCSPGVQLDICRSTMVQNLVILLREKIITPKDLDGFSEELRDTLFMFL